MESSALCPVRPLGLEGHCGYFRQNFSRYALNDGTYHWNEYAAEMIDRFLTGRITPET